MPPSSPGFDDGLDEVAVSFMQSDGGLTPAERFSGYQAILSGPAGGVVGYARTTSAETTRPCIGFDMGGTSTDVSRYHGSYEQVTETETAGVTIQAPQLDITTVAAGGGSKLTFRSGTFRVGWSCCRAQRHASYRVLSSSTPDVLLSSVSDSTVCPRDCRGVCVCVLFLFSNLSLKRTPLPTRTETCLPPVSARARLYFLVGPQSVGSQPGPVCYRKGGDLAVTDANLLLGRVLPDYFPKIFGPTEDAPLDVDATRAAFEAEARRINQELGLTGTTPGPGSAADAPQSRDGDERGNGNGRMTPMTPEEVALGYLRVANEAMCRPIREITESKGYETASHVLAAFGGAGPQHACAIARALGMSTVFVHRFCGILSAYGMGLADVVAEAQRPFAGVYGSAAGGDAVEGNGGGTTASAGKEAAAAAAAELASQVTAELIDQGFTEDECKTETLLNLRYEGTDTARGRIAFIMIIIITIILQL